MKRLSILTALLIMLSINSVYSQNVGINEDGSTPDANAILDVKSTNKGILLPRVDLDDASTVAPLSGTVTAGMIIYNEGGNEPDGLYMWDGTVWIKLNDQTHYLGEEYLGGIIFHLYTDSDGLQHGLVVSKIETTAIWSGDELEGADRTEDGAYNTLLMPNGTGSARFWVQNTLNGGAGVNTPWYLPSIDELSLLWHNRYYVNTTARAISSTLLLLEGYYWSSTELSSSNSYYLRFLYGYTTNANKDGNINNVRGVRAF